MFTRTKHRANRLADYLDRARASRPSASTATARRRSAPRRSQGSRAGACRVLVATDIAARGIDVDALGHVVNFDVPLVPEDYIHRVGRTGRAEATGEAFTFVSPEEGGDLARHRARDRPAAAARDACRTSTTRRARRRGSKSRWPSASPRSARAGIRPRREAQGRAFAGSGQGRDDAPARPHGSGHGSREPAVRPSPSLRGGKRRRGSAGRKWRFRPRRRTR